MSSISKKRESLKSKSSSFKEAISKNIDDIKSGSVNVRNASLIGGGILLGGYLLYKMISSDSEVDSENNEKLVVVQAPKQESIIAKKIKQSIATFLLAIARQKLLEYLDSRNDSEVEE